MECPIEDQCLLLWPKVGLDQADQVLGLENPKLIPNSLLTPICGIRRPQGLRAQALPRSEGKEDRHQHLSNEKPVHFLRPPTCRGSTEIQQEAGLLAPHRTLLCLGGELGHST